MSDEHENTTEQKSNPILSFYLAPGKIYSWYQYHFAQHGQIQASRRRYGNRLIEFFYASVFWVIFVGLLYAYFNGYLDQFLNR
jgi:hypothetical protein